MKTFNLFKLFSLSLLWLWLTAFAIIPLLCMLSTSLIEITETGAFIFHLDRYAELFTPVYLYLIFKSILLGIITTVICLLLGYPFALFISQIHQRFRRILLFLILLPFWTSALLRIYAIMTILKKHGIINTLLLKLQLIHQPLDILFSKTAVLIGLVYNLLPFMILPIYHNLERLDTTLFEAAHDLGASHHRTFFKVILPLSYSGILTGCTMVFLPAITLFYIPDLLGGAKSMLIGNLIQHEFLVAQNWPLGSALGITLLISIGIVSYCIYYVTQRTHDV